MMFSKRRFKVLATSNIGRDSADHNQQKLMTLSLDEFLHRFLLHLLPTGFVRIRSFGFLANRRHAVLLPFCFAALGAVSPQTQPQPSRVQPARPLWLCPQCGGPMVVIEKLSAAEIQLRSPPFSRRSRRMKLQLQAPSLAAPSAPAGVVRPSCPQTSCPFPTSAQTLAPTTRKLQPNLSCFRFFHL